MALRKALSVGLERLSLRHEAAGVEQAHDLGIGVDGLADQLGVDAVGHARRLEAEHAVALDLARGHRIHGGEGRARRFDMLRAEVLPDEPPVGADPRLAKRRDLLELVVLVEERRVQGVVAAPGQHLLSRDVIARGDGHALLVPDARVVDERRLDVRVACGAGEDEGLVPEGLERRAELAADHALPAVEPVGGDADPHTPCLPASG